MAHVAAGDLIAIEPSSLTHYFADETRLQDASPQHLHRATLVEGSARAAMPLGMALEANTYEDAWIGHRSGGNIDLVTGSFHPSDVDIALPASGVASWIIGRNYNAVQESASSHHDADSLQGWNWGQSAMPEIRLYMPTPGTPSSDDKVYLVAGVDRFVEFARRDTDPEFNARQGAAGVFQHVAGGSGEPDLFVLTDQHGTRYTFFTPDLNDEDAEPAHGQLWTIEDEAGNVAYVGHATDAAVALAEGYDATSGAVTTAFDAADRRYTFTYGSGRLEEVEVEVLTGGDWENPSGTETVAHVWYAYYGSSEDHGSEGDLKSATVLEPGSGAEGDVVRSTYYRYYTGSYHTDNNPGHPHALKYVYEAEGVRRMDWSGEGSSTANVIDGGFETATDGELESYASVYFEYHSDRRIREAWFNGECGCASSGQGTYTYEYEQNPQFPVSGGYQSTWWTRAIVGRPDGSYLTQYFDKTGQALHRVITDGDPAVGTPERWVTRVERSSTGFVTEIHTPAANESYDHDTTEEDWLGSFSSTGLIWAFERVSAGNLKGMLQDRLFKQGTGGDAYFLEKRGYTSATLTINNSEVVRPFLNSLKRYPVEQTSGGSGFEETAYLFTVGSGELMPSKVVTRLGTWSSAKNGTGTTDDVVKHLGADGRVTFEVSARGRITYTAYVNGQVTTRIEDADVSLTGSGQDFHGVTIPGGLSSPSDSLHHKTTYAYDAQGRRATTTAPNGRVSRAYHTRLADARRVVLSYPRFEAGSPDTFHGPVSYTVYNHGRRVEVQGQVGLTGNTSTMAIDEHVDDGESDPIAAVDVGSLVRLRTTLHSDSGAHVEAQRVYFDIPGSGEGTAGTHFDQTLFGEDEMGRQVRVVEPSGTIRRTTYDAIGRVAERWMGTNDRDFPGGMTSGTDDMVRIEELQYDGGNDKGNSHLTQRRLHLDGSGSSHRTYAYLHDLRGRVILETNPTSPHQLHGYDNLGRRVATGSYSSASGLDADSDPTSIATNRLALGETFFDERGQVWKTERHEVAVISGSKGSSLGSLTWYDAEGRVIKVRGGQLAKSRYDGLGRLTHEYVLGKDVDSDYGDAAALHGDDFVLEEHQTTYGADGSNVLMRASIARRHHDRSSGAVSTTGPLDTNADDDPLEYTADDLEGRIQISAMWYDDLDRLVDEVQFGTYGGLDFDRDGMSVPARSNTALRTSYAYGPDGEVLEITDPRAIIQRTERDDAGRVVTSIRNYLPGVNGGGPTGSDQNVTVRYEYHSGLRTKLVADLPSGSTDQETLYIYGTTTSTPSASKISSGHLLRAVRYPDSTSSAEDEEDVNSDASDVVSYAYNAQGEEVWRQDQAGNVFESTRDGAGRLTQSRVTTLASGFDGAVRRIETAYDPLGRRQTVTQLDSSGTSGGTVLDQAGFSYDGWSNVASYRQDVDSVLGGSGDDEYEVSYTWAKATGGRASLRRTGITLPSGASVSLDYRSASGRFDDAVSRVTTLTHGTTVVVSYDYLGLGQVVGTDYPEPEIRWRLYEGNTTGDYTDLDEFGRVVHSRWTKYGLTLGSETERDFYSVSLEYDRNSNITWAQDGVHSGFDVKYSMDGIDRLIQAEEGTRSGGSITGTTRDQQWTLDQVGNWNRDKLDLDGDGNFTGTDEWDDCRTHNDVNEIETRTLDCYETTPTDIKALAYDAAGNLIDDGNEYKYVYDAFYRLRFVKDQSNDVVSEHRYNGLGHRIAVHADTDDDGDVDGSDTWEHLAYDERWRLIARYWAGDTNPHEEFLHHQAGLDGHGGSSYIDLVALRDRDTDDNGSLDERIYYCQNWRADVSVLLTDGGKLLEWLKYSAYGVPFVLPRGDANSDGEVSTADLALIEGWSSSNYDVRGDIDLDGQVGSTDLADLEVAARITFMEAVNDLGFGGREHAAWDAVFIHARGGPYHASLGRGLTRDESPVQFSAVQRLGLNEPRYPNASMYDTWGDFWGWLGSVYDNCCRECHKNHKPNAAVPGMVVTAMVCCCVGTPIVCNFARMGLVDAGLPSGSEGQRLARTIILDCMDEHEEGHIVEGHEDCAPSGHNRPAYFPNMSAHDSSVAESELIEEELGCLGRGQNDDCAKLSGQDADDCWNTIHDRARSLAAAQKAYNDHAEMHQPQQGNGK